MAYFRELPNIKYPSFLKDKNSSLEFIEVKNFFRRVKLREDLQNILTIFNKYEIPMGFRPDNVAEELYGSAELDWVVITCAGIVNIRDEWPLDPSQIYNFSESKYGENLNETRYIINYCFRFFLFFVLFCLFVFCPSENLPGICPCHKKREVALPSVLVFSESLEIR